MKYLAVIITTLLIYLRQFITILTFILLLPEQTVADTLHIDQNIVGLNQSLLTNANKRLKAMKSDLPINLSINQIRHYYRQGFEEIKKAVAPYGYFNPIIKGTLEQQSNIWTANYCVNLGKKIYVNKLSLKMIGAGEKQATLTQLVTTLPKTMEGKPFTTASYDQLIATLLTTIEHQGYIKVKLKENKINIDRKAYTCTISITIDTGKRYYFGEVHFSPSPFKASFLQSFIPFRQGSPYNYQELINLQHTLASTQYFSNVGIKPKISKATSEQHVPIDINLSPNSQKIYQIGLGYGTGTGTRVTIGNQWHWLNSTGDHFSIAAQLSRLNKNFSAQYIIPGAIPANQQYSITTTSFQLTPQDSRSFGIRTGLGYQLQFDQWKSVYGIQYLIEHYRKDPDDPYKTASLLMPTFTWQRHITNKVLNPSYDNQFNFTVNIGLKLNRSTANFIQPIISEQLLFPITNNFRIKLRATLGNTFVDELIDLPVSIAFYSGGNQSVRGYGEQELGPGRHLITGSIEFRRRTIGNWWLTTFMDVGNAFDDYNRINLQRSAGAGLLWHSPIGPITVGLAKSVSDSSQRLRFLFSVGTS